MPRAQGLVKYNVTSTTTGKKAHVVQFRPNNMGQQLWAVVARVAVAVAVAVIALVASAPDTFN